MDPFRVALILALTAALALLPVSLAPAAAPTSHAATPSPTSHAATPSPTSHAATPSPTATSAGVDRAFEDAKRNFDRGIALFDAGNFEAALAEFERAYDELAGHPKQYFVLDHLGMCHERLFRYGLALRYYRRYLDEGGAAAPAAADVRASIRALEGLLATVHLESNVKAEVWVDDRLAGEAPGSIVIPGGRHVVELRAPRHEAAKKELSIAARETQSHRFTLEPLGEGLPSTYFWVGAGLSVVSLGAGTALGLVAVSKDNETRKEIDDYGYPKAPDAAETARDYALAADIAFGSAALFGVATTILYFLTEWEGAPADARVDAATRAPARAARAARARGFTLPMLRLEANSGYVMALGGRF